MVKSYSNSIKSFDLFFFKVKLTMSVELSKRALDSLFRFFSLRWLVSGGGERDFH